MGKAIQDRDQGQFPINRRHQRMATRVCRACGSIPKCQFPINRRHQRMATGATAASIATTFSGFQSIGVTKEWRQGCIELQGVHLGSRFPINRRHQRMATPAGQLLRPAGQRFQSIGVTKEWRPNVSTISATRSAWVSNQ